MIADCRRRACWQSLGRAAGCWLSKSTVSGDVFDAGFWRQLVRDGCLDLWSSARGSGTVWRCALFPCQVLRAFAPLRETLRSCAPHPVRNVSREGTKEVLFALLCLRVSIPACLGSVGPNDDQGLCDDGSEEGRGARCGVVGRRRWCGFCEDGAWALGRPLQTSEWRRERGHCAQLTLRHS